MRGTLCYRPSNPRCLQMRTGFGEPLRTMFWEVAFCRYADVIEGFMDNQNDSLKNEWLCYWNCSVLRLNNVRGSGSTSK